MSSTRFVRRSGIFFCLIALVFAAGCASSGRSNSNRQIEDTAIREMGTCLKSTPKGNIAQCARQLYSLLNSRLSDSEPDKVPLLISATKLLTLFTKFDRGEITSNQEMQNGISQISNELKLDQQRARYYSAAQSESPRILRRLHTLRRWSHEQEIKPFFTRGARTRCPHGARTPRRVPIIVGHH